MIRMMRRVSMRLDRDTDYTQDWSEGTENSRRRGEYVLKTS